MNKLSSKIKDEKLVKILIVLGFAILTITFFRIIYTMFYPSIAPITEETKVLRLENIFKNFSAFFSFSNQSNFFLGLATVLLGFGWERRKQKQIDFFFAAIITITITFIIFWAVISWSNRAKWTSEPFSMILSVLVHAVTPIIGFITLWLIKSKVVITFRAVFWASFYTFAYFCFALVLYFITKAVSVSNLPVVIYRFLNFEKPFFYGSGNIFVIILLDILILLAGSAIPYGLAMFWKVVYRMKIQKPFFNLKTL